MRQLEAHEVASAARELAELAIWQEYRDYALKYYGPTAYKVSVETDSEYNDEGGSYWIVTGITVYNAANEVLDPDINSEAVKQLLKDVGLTPESEDTEIIDGLEDALSDIRCDMTAPDGDEDFMVQEEPKMKYKKVFVED